MDNQEQQPLLPPPLPQPFTPPQHSPQNAAKPPTSRRTDFSPNDGNPNNHSLYLTAPTATPLATQSSTAQSATASPGHSALTCHKSPRPPAHPFTSDPHKIAPIEKIPYDIHAFSSHSPAYHPRNILEDKPSDQSSRWSSGTNDHMQYITIKLEKMAIV
ncbi:Muskelin N-terminus-domain-containing protein, partial [Jimgerdemannia flammicorona]